MSLLIDSSLLLYPNLMLFFLPCLPFLLRVFPPCRETHSSPFSCLGARTKFVRSLKRLVFTLQLELLPLQYWRENCDEDCWCVCWEGTGCSWVQGWLATYIVVLSCPPYTLTIINYFPEQVTVAKLSTCFCTSIPIQFPTARKHPSHWNVSSLPFFFISQRRQMVNNSEEHIAYLYTPGLSILHWLWMFLPRLLFWQLCRVSECYFYSFFFIPSMSTLMIAGWLIAIPMEQFDLTQCDFRREWKHSLTTSTQRYTCRHAWHHKTRKTERKRKSGRVCHS